MSGRTVIYLTALAVAVYLGMVVLGDMGSLMEIRVAPVFVAAFLCLAFGNYLLRAAKWHLYSAELGVGLPFRKNALIFLAGLSMTITPVRVGEVLKCYLTKRFSGFSISRSLPAVAVERLTDLVSLCLLALTGVFLNSGYALLAGLFCLAMVALLLGMKSESVYSVLVRLPVVKRFVEQMAEVQRSGTELVSRRVVGLSIALTVPAWLLECIGLWLLVSGLGVEASLASAVFIFSFSSVFGALSMLPGGLGAAEASFTVLLTQVLGIGLASAVWLTIVTRLCTLWFGTGIGVASLVAAERMLGREGEEAGREGDMPGRKAKKVEVEI